METADKKKSTLGELIRLDITPAHGDPPQPMLKLTLAPNTGAVLMGFARVDELIAELIQCRDIVEDLFYKRYPEKRRED